MQKTAQFSIITRLSRWVQGLIHSPYRVTHKVLVSNQDIVGLPGDDNNSLLLCCLNFGAIQCPPSGDEKIDISRQIVRKKNNNTEERSKNSGKLIVNKVILCSHGDSSHQRRRRQPSCRPRRITMPEAIFRFSVFYFNKILLYIIIILCIIHYLHYFAY